MFSKAQPTTRPSNEFAKNGISDDEFYPPSSGSLYPSHMLVVKDGKVIDKSPAAKAARRRILVKAVYGEFMCSLLFFTPIYCLHANASMSGWNSQITSLANAFVSGLQAIGCIFAFSSISGAQFNSALSFSLWMTGKLSNRRVVLYIAVQMLASIVAMAIVAATFSGDLQSAYEACAVVPRDGANMGKVFATEFFTTFFLAFVAFVVAFEDAEKENKSTMSIKSIKESEGLTLYASTPQSKTGFAPFAIGFTIFSLCLWNGSSGGAFNPPRMFGPAIFSGKWHALYLYWIAQMLGATVAAVLVHRLSLIGVSITATNASDGKSATQEIIDAASEHSYNNGNNNNNNNNSGSGNDNGKSGNKIVTVEIENESSGGDDERERETVATNRVHSSANVTTVPNPLRLSSPMRLSSPKRSITSRENE